MEPEIHLAVDTRARAEAADQHPHRLWALEFALNYGTVHPEVPVAFAKGEPSLLQLGLRVLRGEITEEQTVAIPRRKDETSDD